MNLLEFTEVNLQTWSKAFGTLVLLCPNEICNLSIVKIIQVSVYQALPCFTPPSVLLKTTAAFLNFFRIPTNIAVEGNGGGGPLATSFSNVHHELFCC